ncbi:MAG TPA: helix-turn-helix transcriptional regulator [Gemmatimonadaceae bacterium]|jgi:AraC family transcriptional regulator|nr:helix-turn-helix transcriptional regulator [Gemmatimonadaceae bacterium]
MPPEHTFPVPAFTRLRKHEHDGPHICAVLEGGFIEREKSGWRDVGAGSLRVSGAASHDIDFSGSGASCLVLETLDASRLPESAQFIERDPRLERIVRSIARADQESDPASKVLFDDLTSELLAQIGRIIDGKVGPPPSWLAEIRDRIHDDVNIDSVESLATRAGVHRVHLARAFHDHYGVSVTRYLRSVRARRALSLIMSTHLGLSYIAAESGYADQSHLTREIRALTGRTPGVFRSMLHTFKTA